jgi:hypothetical protein
MCKIINLAGANAQWTEKSVISPTHKSDHKPSLENYQVIA